eukprot:SAG31_NODE_38007_length_299_cov_2.240000_1_plen_74_part_10
MKIWCIEETLSKLPIVLRTFQDSRFWADGVADQDQDRPPPGDQGCSGVLPPTQWAGLLSLGARGGGISARRRGA